MRFEEAGKCIIGLLGRDLPTDLYYHNAAHTLDVYNAADRIALAEGIAGADRKLLLTAAWFHDAGFLRDRADHETLSCDIAREMLPEFDYDAADIARICTIIMATKLPQTPGDLLGEILADADLDYLGRDDFFGIAGKLYEEFRLEGIVASQQQWNLIQVRFFENHHYFTKTARAERELKKEQNLQLIKAELE